MVGSFKNVFHSVHTDLHDTCLSVCMYSCHFLSSILHWLAPFVADNGTRVSSVSSRRRVSFQLNDNAAANDDLYTEQR